ncbi:PadR family transcriptional regulator [Halorientalis marina]|jgi:DNA-binding PadR family transcriptional regulator|uniref:PadR family transcriptional regulator n=1 Tax=Halorientalis marina TaxID=2931976 RepID=UPI001FF5EFD5|nr:PadR family transcriptional regulator [Halorientalis marina]
MHDLTAFQRDILYVLAGSEDAYGLAIKRELEGYYEGDVNHGRLYPNLDDLVERGYVEKGQIDRRTNSYNLTEAGAAEIERRREWETEYLPDDELLTA